jgi:hypothetical protein
MTIWGSQILNSLDRLWTPWVVDSWLRCDLWLHKSNKHHIQIVSITRNLKWKNLR